MSPLVAVFKLSLRVLLKGRRTLIIGAFCCFPILASIIVSMVVLSGIGDVGLSAFGIVSKIMEIGYLYVLLVVVTLFYGTALIADEIDEKTITYLFMRPVPKSTIYFGKYLAYLAAGGLLLLPTAALSFLISMTADPPGEAIRHFPIMMKDLGVLAMGLLAYGAFYAMIGVISKRPIFIGLGFAFLWDSGASFVPGKMSKLTIKHYLLTLWPHPVQQRGVLGFFESATPEWLAVTILFGVTAGLVVLGAYLFTHKEYVLEQ